MFEPPRALVASNGLEHKGSNTREPNNPEAGIEPSLYSTLILDGILRVRKLIILSL